MTNTAVPGYTHISELVEEEPQAAAAPPRLFRARLWAAAALVALLLPCAAWGRRSLAGEVPSKPLDAVTADEALAADAAGGCGYDMDCSKQACCTQSGFKCVKTSAWWSACVKATSAAEGPGSEEKEEAPAKLACSAGGESCTKSKCCADTGYACTKRTALWWESICKKSGSGDAPEKKAEPAAEQKPPARAAERLAPPCAQNGEEFPSMDAAQACAQKLVKSLSLAEKVTLLHGQTGGMGYAGYMAPKGVITTRGAMRLTMNDGPQGYNGYQEIVWGKATEFPDLISVAATFDAEASKRYGAAVAEEFKKKGCNVLLGPDVEVIRSQHSGRTFETLSGEDPYLGNQLAHAYVREVQKRGIIATAKHWLDNNQETDRQQVNVEVSDRAQHEIYMPSFKGAIDAGAGAVMCSYNKVYGEYACENSKLLRDLLRKDLGFKGFVVSDWGATHHAERSLKGGLNVEMPEAQRYTSVSSLVTDGDVPEATVDELASQVLTSMYGAGLFDGKYAVDWKWPPAFFLDATSDDHRAVARTTITDSAVLLKNRGSTLPLRTKGLKIALVGQICKSATGLGAGSAYSGGGSGYVATTRSVTPLEGLKDLVKDAASITWSSGASGAEGADVAVVCAAAHAEEGKDRKDLYLPQAEELVTGLRALPGGEALKVVMVAMVPGAVTTDAWIGGVDAALVLWMPGEQAGPAIAQLLTGEASPGGRLPVSFPKDDEQRFTKEQFPGVDLVSKFSEGVLVGYRWNDAKGVASAFPFGFGLGYTEFRFSDFSASCDGKDAKVTLSVANVGGRDGAAVPQVYVGFPSLAPVKRQLRGFKKVRVPAGGAATVEFTFGEADWSFYDETLHAWKSATALGEAITFSVGSSSADLQWSNTVHCAPGFLMPPIRK